MTMVAVCDYDDDNDDDYNDNDGGAVLCHPIPLLMTCRPTNGVLTGVNIHLYHWRRGNCIDHAHKNNDVSKYIYI